MAHGSGTFRYFNHVYVGFGFVQETAAKVKNTEQYMTNQLVHDGIREDARGVMKKLFNMTKGEYN